LRGVLANRHVCLKVRGRVLAANEKSACEGAKLARPSGCRREEPGRGLHRALRAFNDGDLHYVTAR
jgi:hypothetical protein